MSRGSKRKKIRKPSRAAVSKQSNQSSKDLDFYLQQKDFSAAIAILRKQIIPKGTDQQYRLLAQCYSNVNNYAEAILALKLIQSTTYLDLRTLGTLLAEINDWDEAIQQLRSSLRLSENALTYFELAKVSLCSRETFESVFDEQGEATKAEAARFLDNAIDLPNCPEQAYLLLCDLLGWDEPTDLERRVEILTLAIERYPNSEVARVELAACYRVHLSDPFAAKEVIIPLLQSNESSSDVLWEAFSISLSTQKWDEALSYLGQIQFDQENQIEQQRIEADVLCKAGRIREAIAIYTQNVHNDNIIIKAIAFFGRAAAQVQGEELSLAALDAKEAITQFWNATPSQDKIAIQLTEISVRLKTGSYQLYNDNMMTILYDAFSEENKVGDKLQGELAYIMYNIHQYEEGSEEYLLEAAQFAPHPRMGYHLALLHAKPSSLVQAVEHYLDYCIWMFDEEKLDDLVPFSFDEIIYENTPKGVKQLTKTECLKAHKLILRLLKQCQNDKLIEKVFSNFYDTFWEPMLHSKELFKEASEATTYLSGLSISKLFSHAYNLHRSAHLIEAEQIYRKYLELRPETVAVLCNLAVIAESKKNFDESLELISKALAIEPNNEFALRVQERIHTYLRKIEEEKQRQEVFLQTARERWPQLDYYKQHLVRSLINISGFRNWADLARQTGIEERYLSGHWRKLVEAGIIIEEQSGTTYSVNQYIVDLIQKEPTNTLLTQIIASNTVSLAKPAFNSQLELVIYGLLVRLYPNCLVFPNMALQTIFPYDGMKAILTQEEFNYYLISQVDFCITSTMDYKPIIAFEVDSIYHDEAVQQMRDIKKNVIFQRGGVTLIRIRPTGQPSEETMQKQLNEAIRALTPIHSQ